MVLAIDGPAGVGKSTIAKMIAEKTSWLYLNSGNFYRALTKSCIDAGLDMKDSRALVENAGKIKLEFIDRRLFLDGESVEDKLHNDSIDEWVAQVSVHTEIRDIVNSLLREAARGLDVIVEGRDMTTVVFPDAEYKIYFDASIETRAKRRLDQRTSSQTYDELLASITGRDKIDKSKPVGSLRIADDALYLDTSDLTIDQVCDKVLHTIQFEQK